MGGGNEPGNLIKLRPEDHYMAHLLLAKAHGGKLWFAVAAMSNLPNKYQKSQRNKFNSRVIFGHVRRSLAKHYSEEFSGPSGPQADKRIYLFDNFDGSRVAGNRFKLASECCIDRRAVGHLITGAKKSYLGWFYRLRNPDGKTKIEWMSEAKSNPEIFTLYHHDGREFSGTRSDFKKYTGRPLYWQSGSHVSINGWHISKEDASSYTERMSAKVAVASDARGCISGLENPRADRRIYSFTNIRTGAVERETRVGMRSKHGINSANMCRLIGGKVSHTKGWTLTPANDNNVQLSLPLAA